MLTVAVGPTVVHKQSAADVQAAVVVAQLASAVELVAVGRLTVAVEPNAAAAEPVVVELVAAVEKIEVVKDFVWIDSMASAGLVGVEISFELTDLTAVELAAGDLYSESIDSNDVGLSAVVSAATVVVVNVVAEAVAVADTAPQD